MSDLKLMIERISEREKNAIRNKLNELEKKSELEINQTKIDSEEHLENEKERIIKEFEYEFLMKQNTENVGQRNAILREKQKVIQKTFVAATRKLENISSKDFMKIIVRALENIDVTQSVELHIGEKSKDLFDQDWLNEYLPWNHHVSVHSDLVKNKAGVLVRMGNIDYNYFFDELIKENRHGLLPDVTNKLFVE